MPVSSSDTVCKGADSQIHGMNRKSYSVLPLPAGQLGRIARGKHEAGLKSVRKNDSVGDDRPRTCRLFAISFSQAPKGHWQCQAFSSIGFWPLSHSSFCYRPPPQARRPSE